MEALSAYRRGHLAAFHTPGHKLGAGAPADLIDAVGARLLSADMGIANGLDDTQESGGLLRRAEDLAAAAWGARRSFFTPNGSSSGLQALVMAVAGPGEQVIVPRNAHNIVANITFGDSEASVERLVSALTAIAAGARTSGKKAATQAPPKLPLAGRQAISPREAFFGACEALSLAACVGRVSAEMVVPYPPGIPVLAPGEEITAETVDYLREAAASGILIHGPRDLTLATLQVVAGGLV